MDQLTSQAPEDEELHSFGYAQQFVRTLRHFESFAVAFSFISITTGIFTTYLFAITVAGTDRKSTRLNSSHVSQSRMPSSA